MGGFFSVLCDIICCGLYGLTCFFGFKATMTALEQKNVHIKILCGLVMLYTALACTETFVLMIRPKKAKPWYTIPGLGETLILFYVLIWWFFGYLYMTVYFNGNE